KRRDFLKSTLLFAAVSTVAGKTLGLFNEALATVFVTAGKLGYKEVSPQAKNGKTCGTCKHYKPNPKAGEKAGDCILPAMKSAMKASAAPYVKEEAYCNMWAKK